MGSSTQFRARGISAAVVCTALLTGCRIGVLEPQGPVGAAEKTILIDSVAIMLAIVLPTLMAIFAFAWWFRTSNTRATRLHDWAYSGRIELVVWAIPALVVMLLGGVVWIGSYQLDPYKPILSAQAPLEIQVVSLDWKWLFLYPGQNIASVNSLTVPVGVPLHFSLTSGSVMNAFFIPQLGSMIYTMNGMTTQLNLQADNAGDFHGMSSHFSGEGFSDMNFIVHALPAAAFSAWAEKAAASTQTFDAARYIELTKPSIKKAQETFHHDDARLFHAQAMRKNAGPQNSPPASAGD